MSQSLASVVVHLVFSTKGRIPFLRQQIRHDLFAYLAGTAKAQSAYVYEVGGGEDLVHMLLTLPRTLTLAKLIEMLKTGSTKYLKATSNEFKTFSWQNGYGAFYVSASNMEAARKYIREQERHHQKKSFQDELRSFLAAANVQFDEKYLWD